MNTFRLVATAAVVPLCLAVGSAGSVRAAAERDAPLATDPEAAAIGREAYLYAYPLVLQDVTRQQMTNATAPQFPLAPTNQFANARTVPSIDMREVVRPNVDTLYSTAWLDLGPEPVVLSVPATDHYFMLPLYSLWTDVFAAPGTRTTGRNRAVELLVAGPSWRGEVPQGLELVRAPTRYVGIIGRTQINGPADDAAVHKVQDQFKITPLHARGGPAGSPAAVRVDPAIDMKTPPPVQVDRMDNAAFFERFTSLLKDNPPGPLDYPIVHRMERVGIRVGSPFDLGAAPAHLKEAFEKGVSEGKAELLRESDRVSGASAKGWTYSTRAGTYGTDYLYRAGIARCCLGENLPQDALYPSAGTDSEGQPLDGNGKYVIHFAKGQLPPVDAFWSVTAYDKDGYFIPNPLKRQAIGVHDRLVGNADGSIDLAIQADSPGKDREANWLPVGKGVFTLMMRLYAPRAEAIEAGWQPPPIQRVR